MTRQINIGLLFLFLLMLLNGCRQVPPEPGQPARVTPTAFPTSTAAFTKTPAADTPTASPTVEPTPSPIVDPTATSTNTPPPPPDPIAFEIGSHSEGIGQISLIAYAPPFGPAMSGFGSIWLPHWEDPYRYISRMDPSTGVLQTIIQVGHTTGQNDNSWNLLFTAAVTEEGVWVNDRQSESLDLIDPETNRIVREIPIGYPGFFVVSDGTSLWVSDPPSNTVLRVNPVTGEVEASISVPYAADLAVGGGAIWVLEVRDTQHTTHKVARIDPATNAVVAEIPVSKPGGLLFADGALFALTGREPGVVRIDPDTNEIEAQVVLGGASQDIWGLVYGAGSIWVRVGPEKDPECRDNFIARIDPDSLVEIARVYLPCVGDIHFIDGRLWARIETGSSAFRADYAFEALDSKDQPIIVIDIE